MVESLFSPKETAERSGWPERRIRELVSQNRLRHLRVGNKILLPEGAVEEFISANMVPPTPAAWPTDTVPDEE